MSPKSVDGSSVGEIATVKFLCVWLTDYPTEEQTSGSKNSSDMLHFCVQHNFGTSFFYIFFYSVQKQNLSLLEYGVGFLWVTKKANSVIKVINTYIMIKTEF